jgi:hypothetical protein
LISSASSRYFAKSTHEFDANTFVSSGCRDKTFDGRKTEKAEVVAISPKLCSSGEAVVWTARALFLVDARGRKTTFDVAVAEKQKKDMCGRPISDETQRANLVRTIGHVIGDDYLIHTQYPVGFVVSVNNCVIYVGSRSRSSAFGSLETSVVRIDLVQRTITLAFRTAGDAMGMGLYPLDGRSDTTLLLFGSDIDTMLWNPRTHTHSFGSLVCINPASRPYVDQTSADTRMSFTPRTWVENKCVN